MPYSCFDGGNGGKLGIDESGPEAAVLFLEDKFEEFFILDDRDGWIVEPCAPDVSNAAARWIEDEVFGEGIFVTDIIAIAGDAAKNGTVVAVGQSFHIGVFQSLSGWAGKKPISVSVADVQDEILSFVQGR